MHNLLLGSIGWRILVAGADGGHAFKHAPALGEVIARQVLGKAIELDTAFIAPQRFN